MTKLTDEQREHLRQIVDSGQRGSHFAINIIRLLDSGKDIAYVAKVSFCTADEVQKVAETFQKNGLDAIVNYKADEDA